MRNGIFLVWDQWWLKVSLSWQQILFTTVLVSLLNINYQFSWLQFHYFICIRNQDLLLTDNRLLHSTYNNCAMCIFMINYYLLLKYSAVTATNYTTSEISENNKPFERNFTRGYDGWHWARMVARKFSIGGLWVCARGLDIKKLTKTQLIHSVSCFNLGIWSFVYGSLAPKSPPWWWGSTGLPYFLGPRRNLHSLFV